MTLPLIKRHNVYRAYANGIPFRVRVEFYGYTSNGNPSEKWWEIAFDGSSTGPGAPSPGRGPSVLSCNHGKIGSAGRSTPLKYDIDKALAKLDEKLASGYTYVLGSSDEMPIRKGPDPAEETSPRVHHVVRDAMRKLPAPFDRVVRLRRVRLEAESGWCFAWNAVDEDGCVIATLSESGAEKLKSMLEAA